MKSSSLGMMHIDLSYIFASKYLHFVERNIINYSNMKHEGIKVEEEKTSKKQDCIFPYGSFIQRRCIQQSLKIFKDHNGKLSLFSIIYLCVGFGFACLYWSILFSCSRQPQLFCQRKYWSQGRKEFRYHNFVSFCTFIAYNYSELSKAWETGSICYKYLHSPCGYFQFPI